VSSVAIPGRLEGQQSGKLDYSIAHIGAPRVKQDLGTGFLVERSVLRSGQRYRALGLLWRVRGYRGAAGVALRPEGQRTALNLSSMEDDGARPIIDDDVRLHALVCGTTPLERVVLQVGFGQTGDLQGDGLPHVVGQGESSALAEVLGRLPTQQRAHFCDERHAERHPFPNHSPHVETSVDSPSPPQAARGAYD